MNTLTATAWNMSSTALKCSQVLKGGGRGVTLAICFHSPLFKAISNGFVNLHNYGKNNFCSRCDCVKTGPDVSATLTNFSTDADQFPPCDFSGVDMVRDHSVMFRLPLAIERVMHDTCHSQLLGTGKTANGACVARNLCFFQSFVHFVTFWCMRGQTNFNFL